LAGGAAPVRLVGTAGARGTAPAGGGGRGGRLTRGLRRERRRRAPSGARPGRGRSGALGGRMGPSRWMPQRRALGESAMKVLITGGGGFLGSHLTDAFLDRGDEVFILETGLTLKVKHRIGDPRLHFVRDSVFNEAILEGLIGRVDLVYHLAAVVGVEHYVGDPYEVLNVNVNGTQNVLKLAFKHSKRVVFSSTSEVYGRNPKIPFGEDDDRVLGSTRIDRWCYSTSKAVGEHFCFAYAKMGLKTTIVRYFNVYGPRLDAIDVGRVITIFIGQALRNEPVTVIGDGSQTR